jgi:hypothetical protein
MISPMTRYGSIAVLLCAATLSACDKNGLQELVTTPAAANIKFFNFGVNAPGVNFYADGAKMTAISSTTGTESTTGTVYGSAGNGGLYSSITPGQHVLSGKIAAATDKDLAISNFTATLDNGKYYSLYLSGFYNTTTKTSDSFLIEDNFGATIDFSAAYVRLVNASSNSAPQTLIITATTVDSTRTTVGGPVAYKSAGAFTPVPGGVYDIATRNTGGTTNLFVRTGVSLAVGRVYTVSTRGDVTVTSTTAANRPLLDVTANR